MSYAVQADMVARFSRRELIQLTDRSTPPADAIDPTVLQPALDAASNVIDGYVGAKYNLPLVTTPALLVDLCCDIARYRLYADEPPAVVSDRFKESIATLRDISRGVVKIEPGGMEPESRTEVVETVSDPRMFSRAALTVY